MNRSIHTPNIDRNAFENNILTIQQNEGNNILVVKTINKALKDTKEVSFFDKFITLCAKYNIKYYSKSNKNLFEVIILTNGYESHKLSYKQRNKEISKELSKILYNQLFTEILNKNFIDNVKKTNINITTANSTTFLPTRNLEGVHQQI